jgi:hypothetical protein
MLIVLLNEWERIWEEKKKILIFEHISKCRAQNTNSQTFIPKEERTLLVEFDVRF